MLVNSIILLLTINSVELGVGFGPIFPTGTLERTNNTNTAGSVFCDVSNFSLDYSFSKLNSKNNTQDNLYLHSGTISIQYPFYNKNTRCLQAILGGSYNRLIRKLGIAREQSYALGVRYGIGYKEKLANVQIFNKLRPALSADIFLNQIVQTRNWNAAQLSSSNFLISIIFGISFNLL
jgi:hypothetical protein